MSDVVIVHLGTVVQSTFGRLVDGNVLPLDPIQARVQQFSLPAFAEAHQVVSTERDEGVKRMTESGETPQLQEPTPPNPPEA